MPALSPVLTIRQLSDDMTDPYFKVFDENERPYYLEGTEKLRDFCTKKFPKISTLLLDRAIAYTLNFGSILLFPDRMRLENPHGRT